MHFVAIAIACLALTGCVGFGVSGQVCLDPKPVNTLGKAVLDLEAGLHAKCFGGAVNADSGKMEVGISGGMSTPQPVPAAPAPASK